MSSRKTLQDHAAALLRSLEALRPLPGLLGNEGGLDLRQALLLFLRTKILPELEAAHDLPIFVAIQGGTNVGKSTVFNALAGRILSPAVVQGSATKHPLIYAHERWRNRLLVHSPFPGVSAQELADPKELLYEPERTERYYFRFHEDASLEEFALIDSPDFDGALLSNLEVARAIAALADVGVFVTTAQKYRDRELVEHLRSLRELKVALLLVLNQVDEEIVFETLIDDLERLVPLRSAGIGCLRLPAAIGKVPEEVLREPLRGRVLGMLAGLRREELKPRILERTIDRVLEGVGELRQRYQAELRWRERLSERGAEVLEREVLAYSQSFNLALPEETLAIRRLLRRTEIGPHLRLPKGVEGASQGLRLVAAGLGRLLDGARDALLRLTRTSEGTIDENPAILADYARSRDEADFQEVRRAAERLRAELESFTRQAEDGSALARALLGAQFGSAQALAFPDELRRAFQEEVREPGCRGERVLEDLDRWLAANPLRRRAIVAGANLFKLAGGATVAALVWLGFFSIITWLGFALGWFAGAYVVALVLSRALRRKHRFRAARIACLRRVLDRALTQPLTAALDALVSRADLDTMAKAAKALASHKSVSERQPASA